jgi:hypothetical protein
MLLAALRYGAPDSNDLAFTAHIELTGGFDRATPEQMKELQDNASFISERSEKAVAVLENQKQWRRKHTAVMDALPPADPVSLQPYSIEYSIAPRQLALTPSENGDSKFHIEIIIMTYDALGKKVQGWKQTVECTIAASAKGGFQASDLHLQQEIQMPDRATLLRMAVRDAEDDRIGSLEVPLWAISSPYRRKVLPLPALPHDLGKTSNPTQ